MDLFYCETYCLGFDYLDRQSLKPYRPATATMVHPEPTTHRCAGIVVPFGSAVIGCERYTLKRSHH